MPHALQTDDKAFMPNNFDLIRVAAALQVLLFHSAFHLRISLPWWLAPLEQLHGVPIFFAASGFLISASYERGMGLQRYIRNRVLRIYPGLWLIIFCTAVVLLFFGQLDLWEPQAAIWLVSQAAGIIYTPASMHGFGFGSYNGSLWTIPIELQFYVALPLLYWVGRKCQNVTWLLVVVWGVSLVLAWIWLQHSLGHSETRWDKVFRYSLLPHLHIFVFGILLHRLKLYASAAIRGKGLLWLGGYLLLATAMPESATAVVVKNLLLGLTTLSVAYSWPGTARTMLKGYDVSYGIYIYHGLIVNIFVELNLQGKFSYLSAVVVLTLVCSFVSWIVVERPVLRFKTTAAAAPLVGAST
jgi:peptidoglycan/LPS O-acetylase OafA/YrhL